jgi:hypothetical protein
MWLMAALLLEPGVQPLHLISSQLSTFSTVRVQASYCYVGVVLGQAKVLVEAVQEQLQLDI